MLRPPKLDMRFERRSDSFDVIERSHEPRLHELRFVDCSGRTILPRDSLSIIWMLEPRRSGRVGLLVDSCFLRRSRATDST